jgi:hypothetical protein
MGCRKWEMGYGIWDMGCRKWDMGYGTVDLNGNEESNNNNNNIEWNGRK